MKKLFILAIAFLGLIPYSFSQNWRLGGNNAGPPPNGVNATNNILGTNINVPLRIATNGTERARFTTNNTMGSGDGLSITSQSGNPLLNLDIWVDNSPPPTAGSHIRWAHSGLAEGANSQFRVSGFNDGLWLNAGIGPIAAGGTPRMIFNIHGVETGRFNSNANKGFMRIGANPANIDAFRRLEVFDNANAPQFRIAQATGHYADFQVTDAGDLMIDPHNGSNLRNVGIGDVTPGNKLEITSTATNPTPSGLRFTNLKANAVPQVNPGAGVLAVNKFGDVIYVEASGSGDGFGAACSSVTPYDLPDPWRVGLNGHNLFFDGNLQGEKFNNIGLGIPTCSTPEAKLDVYQNSGGTSGTIGIQVINNDFTGGANKEAVGLKVKTNQIRTIAGWFEVPNNFYKAVYVPQSMGRISVGFTTVTGGTSTSLLDVNGDIYATGVTNGTAWVTFSDEQLKTNIDTFSGGLDVIRNVQPFSYKYNGKGGLDTTRTYVGVIANELEQIAPYAIDTFSVLLDTSDAATTLLRGVKTEAMLYTAINAIRELDNTVAALPAGNTIQAGNGLTYDSPEIKLGGNLTERTLISMNHNSMYFTGEGNMGIGVDNSKFKFEVNGDVNINGRYYQNGSVFTSDSLFKTNVMDIENAAGIVSQLSPKTFYFDTANTYGLNFSNRKQYGLIAQEVEQVLPELVTGTTKPAVYDSLGNTVSDSVTYKTLNYNAFIAMLIAASQEQQKKIDSLQQVPDSLQSQISSLQSQIAQIQNCIDNLPQGLGCGAAERKAQPQKTEERTFETEQEITLTDVQSIILDQNSPNPFKEQTTITWFLPEEVGEARLVFFTQEGAVIKEVSINGRGSGRLQVYAHDLSHGIYTYSLIADGKVIETKKMVRVR